MSDTNKIDVLSSENRVFPPPEEISANAHIKSIADYEDLYEKSIADPEAFWSDEAEKRLSWFKKWDKTLEWDFHKPEIKWFSGGKLNVCHNCIDKHLNSPTRNKAAIIWEGDNGEYRSYTYQQLFYEVNRFANVLKKHGIKKGDVVTIYLPMIPELAFAMLACTRIGAIHSIIFGGFSANAIRDRVHDSESCMVITADMGVRGGKSIPLKDTVDTALEESPTVKKVIVVERTGEKVNFVEGRDFWWHEEINSEDINAKCSAEEMNSEDPLFILYTSGSTGKPKGVLHTTAGYLLYANITFQWIFDYQEKDIHFCTADIGWITGHSYIIYGPLSNGATTLMFEGIPTYPTPSRFWDIVDKHQVNIFYTAPTAIRALMKDGEEWVNKNDLSSLRILGTVGEPINPEAWMWYYKNVGKEKLPIVDTWWQTETGGILITPLPGATTLKPGSAARPFPGIEPKVLKEDGSPAKVNEGGYLVIEKPWPGMLRGTYGDPENTRVKEVYFSRFPGKYFTGDSARFDEDGYFWLMGRVDDVINISGHRIGTAEVESALVSHPAVAEAAVVGYPHEIKGEALYVYVTLKDGHEPTEEMRKILINHVRKEISPIATPDKLQFSPALPKTRSGKIMRRILRKIAGNELENLGDTSTLADPTAVDSLIKGKI
ncbi:MAG: acetate--CoA ligase [Nitrospinae bacterium]|nr:acetate--CoA ligase [Nitrospinota bacterium]